MSVCKESDLIEFFRSPEGAAMGRHGDAMHWTPRQTAQHYLDKLPKRSAPGSTIDLLRLAAEYLKPAVGADGWISADKQLPELSTPLDQKHVWVYVPDLPYGYGPDRCQHVGCYYEMTGWRIVGSHTDRKVSHWRPMPGVPA